MSGGGFAWLFKGSVFTFCFSHNFFFLGVIFLFVLLQSMHLFLLALGKGFLQKGVSLLHCPSCINTKNSVFLFLGSVCCSG